MKKFLDARSIRLVIQVLALVFFSVPGNDFTGTGVPGADAVAEYGEAGGIGKVGETGKTGQCSGPGGCVYLMLGISGNAGDGLSTSMASGPETGFHTAKTQFAPPVGPPKMVL